MKKFIALFLSVIMMFSCLGVAASATSVVGRSSTPLGPQTPTEAPTEKPSRPENNVVNNVTNVTNITNNNITIMPEEDPTTIFGFLYRVIKTIVPYLYKILSMLRIDISFGAQNACGNCGSTTGCNCNGNANDNTVIVIPTLPSVPSTPTVPSVPGGNTDSDSADSDSADSDSDSMDSILGNLFGDLFA